MKEEFEQSLAICEDILTGKAGWDKLFETPNFFSKYRHFIVLEVAANSEDDQLEWYGLVESKIRHLIKDLEKEAIEYAHIWPKPYPSQAEGQAKLCCYWFVGLVITLPSESATGQSQNLDLTSPIKAFTEMVMRTALVNKTWKEGMRVEASYKKRKQLAHYLPPEERHKLKTERKASTSTLLNLSSSSPRPAARNPPGDASSPSTTIKRRPSDQDSVSADASDVGNSHKSGDGANPSSNGGSQFDVQPPTKKSNTTTESGEISNGLQVS
jgi:poly(A) polymerase